MFINFIVMLVVSSSGVVDMDDPSSHQKKLKTLLISINFAAVPGHQWAQQFFAHERKLGKYVFQTTHQEQEGNWGENHPPKRSVE